jgi:phosphoribosylaminoimidazolecarboxamide formyltransferase/IMP cyclohydrolase
MPKIALLSVSDKSGIVELAKFLLDQGDWQIVSSGGTAQLLEEHQIPVTRVAKYTGAPEMLGGRVKTLHPKIHGGILARLDVASDEQDLLAHGISPIALVVVNLYPFQQTISRPEVSLEEALEQIDIGGPTLLRAAAKNFKFVTVLCHPSQYQQFMAVGGKPDLALRKAWAVSAFRQVQAYDLAIADYLAGTASYTLRGINPKPLRYGENPHQPATWYQLGETPWGWSSAQQLQGKPLSYNNLLDLESARSLVAEFSDDLPCAVIVKHNNPCGVAIAPTLDEAYARAFHSDSTSAFGGIVALNRPIFESTAHALIATFLECVVAPDCSPKAREILSQKTNLRVLLLPDLKSGNPETVRLIAGGLLVQASDQTPIDTSSWQVVTHRQPDPLTIKELLFAWKVCRHVKSNAIVVSHNLCTVGIGAGQTNRVGAARLALQQAGTLAQGAVLASDGFLPFSDTVELAAEAGISAIIQPGGSLRDQESIDCADRHGISMIFTGQRHFLH